MNIKQAWGRYRQEYEWVTDHDHTYIEVPQFAAALPIIILSDTPAILSFFPKAAASNKWSVVFSNEASIRTLSFIFATPKRVIPRTSPCVHN